MAIIGRRRERQQQEMEAAIARGIEAGVEKAIPAAAMAAQMSSGATYPVTLGDDSPFNQVGPGGGFEPLPREPNTFDSGFGPALPLFPDAIDPLLPSGRTQPRRAEYLIAANINLVDRRVPWSVLKGLAEDVDIVQRCIQIVQDAIVGLNWSWGFSDQIIQQIMLEDGITNSSKANAVARDKYGEELARVQQFFDYPDRRMGFTFSQWLTDIIYSHLVYDGIAIAPEYNLKGELNSLSVIDTSTIKILLDNQGFIPRPPNPAYQQILYGFPRGEFQAENVDKDGKIPDAYTSDQLAYYIRRPRAHSVYGYSQVEECINIATIYMERQAWLHAEYTNGVTPKMAVTVDGTETWSPEQLAYYERIYNDQFSGQTARRQQFMLFRPGMKPEQLRSVDEAYKNTYDEWLVAQIGAKFGIPQASLGIPGKSQLGGGGAHKEQGDQYEEYATDALKNFLIDCVNDLARRFLGVGPELTLTANGGGNDEDAMMRASADAADVSAGIRTRNEVRAERGIPLIDEPEADQLGVSSGQGVTFLKGMLAQQESQQAQGGQQPAGAPSGPEQPKPESGDAASPDGSAGSRPAGGDAGAESDRGAAEEGSKPSQGSAKPKPESKPSVKPKDDVRQPDAPKVSAAAKKELDAFGRFAKARMDGHRWRDFEFLTIDPAQAERLNRLGKNGNAALLDEAIAKAGNAQALIDWYVEGADGQIDWGQPGDFDQCVAIAGKHLDDPEGFCQLRHMEATGETTSEHAAAEKADADYASIIDERSGKPSDQDLYDRVIAEAKKKFDVYPSAVANAWVVREYKSRGGSYRAEKSAPAGHAFYGNQYASGLSDSGLKADDGKTVTLSRLKSGDHIVFNQTIHEYLGKHGGEHWARPLNTDGTRGEMTSIGSTATGPLRDTAGVFRVNDDAVERAMRAHHAQKAAGDTFTPPAGVRTEANRALDWIADGHAGDGFTDTGRKRASDLAAGHAISLDTIKRMASFLARHEVDKKGEGWSPGDKGYPSPGRVAWAAWGGDAAKSWVNGILASHDDTEKAFDDEVLTDIVEADEASDIIIKALAPQFDRLREAHAMLDRVRSYSK